MAGENCGQVPLSDSKDLNSTWTFFFFFFLLNQLGKGKEEGEEREGKRIRSLNCLLNFSIWMFKMLPSFNCCLLVESFRDVNWLFICIYFSAWKSAPYGCTNSRNCNNSSAVKSYFTFWLVKGFYIFQTDCT